MGIELGIGESLIVKAIAESTGRAVPKLKDDLRKEGDLGKVAMVSQSLQSIVSGTGRTELIVRLDVEKYPAYNVQAESVDSTWGIQRSHRNCKSIGQCCEYRIATHHNSSPMTGQSQAKKVGIIKKMLAACQGNEAKFVVRSIEGKLRIGLADKTLVVALAHAIVLKNKGGCRAVD